MEPSMHTSVPEGRNQVAHGASRGLADNPPISPGGATSPGAIAKNVTSSEDVAPPGLRLKMLTPVPRLATWATLCRPSGAVGHERLRNIWLLVLVVVGLLVARVDAAPPAPVTDLKVEDVPNDDGTALRLSWKRSADDSSQSISPVAKYELSEMGGLHHEPGLIEIVMSRWLPAWFSGTPRDMHLIGVGAIVDAGKSECVMTALYPGAEYTISILVKGVDGWSSQRVYFAKARPIRNWFNWSKLSFCLLTFAICGTVILCTELARRGKPFYVRPIAGLQAIEEAVGRATEMGKPMLFVPGIMDMNEIDTVAGLTILASVAKMAAEYDTPLEVPTTRALVMTAAREAVQAAALAAGRPDYYNEDRIYYVTDEQFGYVASVCGWMFREKPAACFYLGKFYAESLILAETGNAVGAIQIAGTAETSQLPFFVAACDYTLLGEELFAASAYLSGEPSQLGMLKGQDLGKLGAMFLIVVGCLLATWDGFSPRGTDNAGQPLPGRASFVTETILNSG